MNEQRQETEQTRQTRQGLERGGEASLPPWTPFVRTGQVVTIDLPNAPDGMVYENSRYLVVMRDCGGGGEGKLIWLSIKNVDNSARHDWRDFQRIKNELVGEEVEAVELYPAESRLVDNANQFHLFCVVGFRFPFGFEERLVSEDTPGVTQRPFEPDMRPSDLTTLHVAELERLVVQDVEVPVTVLLPRNREQRFPFGELAITHDAALALHNAGQTSEPYLLRHLAAEWGDLQEEDRQANNLALENGERLLSCYDLPSGAQLWIITEANRANTTVLTPNEY